MSRLQRTGRACLVVTGCLLLLVAILAGGGKYLLGTEMAAERVSQRLSMAVGLPVKVGHINLGWDKVTLEDVRVYEPDAKPAAEPFAVIDRARVDLSPWDMMHGDEMPKQLNLQGATVTFVLDRNGRPITRLMNPPQAAPPGPVAPPPPGPSVPPPEQRLPAIDIEKASLVIRQEGHADTTLTGIDVHLRSNGDALEVEGTVDDPLWGSWDARGEVNRGSGQGTVALWTTRPVAINEDLLTRVPFAEPQVIKEVQLDGQLGANIHAKFDLQKYTIDYRASFTPQKADVFLPALDLRVNHVHGRLDVANGLLHLNDLYGDTAGGGAEAHGDLNFFRGGIDAQLTVDVRGVEMEQLPRTWDLPREAGGKLTGSAHLHSTYHEGHAEVRGQGQGKILDARLLGRPVEPVPMTLTADATGFHFRLQVAKAILNAVGK